MTSINRTKKFIEEIEEQSYYIKKVKQFDDVKLDYELYSNSLEFDVTGSTIEVRALKPDGGIVIQNSGYIIAKNKITVDLKREITEADGTAIVEIKIKKDRKQITTFSLKLEIEKSALNSELGKKSLVEILVELDTKLDITNNKISLLDNKNALASTNISNLDSRNNTATSNINTLKQQNISAENNSRDLATKNSTATSNISVLDSKISLASTNIKNLDSKNTTASSNISTLDSKNNTANSNIRDLDNKNNTASSNINSLNSKNNTATSNIGNLDTRNTTATSNINELKKQNTIAETNSRDLITKNNTAQNTKNELDRWVQENNNIINLDRRVNENTGKINNNSNEISNMKEAITNNRPIIINEDTPIGTIIWWSAKEINSIDNSVWKICNGQSLAKEEYPDLFKLIGNNSNYNNSGGDNFNLPNLVTNQRFIRSVDSNNNAGAIQDDSLKLHRHTDTYFDRENKDGWVFVEDNQFIPIAGNRFNSNTPVEIYKDENRYVGGSETRPKNIAFIPLIKCKQRAKDMTTVAQEWTNFKENGGEVGGDIDCKGKLYSNQFIRKLNTDTIENDYTMGLGLDSRNETLKFGIGKYGGVFSFCPPSNNSSNLGSEVYKFKDIWIANYSKNANGYSKLLNGIVIQWGNSTLSGSGHSGTVTTNSTISFPISFPSRIFYIGWTLGANNYDHTKFPQYGILYEHTKLTSFRPYALVASQGAWHFEVNWFAIGM